MPNTVETLFCRIDRGLHQLTSALNYPTLKLQSCPMHLPTFHSYMKPISKLFAAIFYLLNLSFAWGSHTATAYSSCGLTSVLYAISLISVGNQRGKSQSIIEKVKPIDYQLYNRISHNWHQIINYYSICTLCFYIT